MEPRRHILPSSYPAHPLSLDDPSGLLRGGPRLPLTDSAGNSQSQQGQPFLGLYHHDNKEMQPRGVDRPMYPTPTVPSSLQSMVPSWERHNRQINNRRRRQQKFSRNPIVDSPHYKAYRARQNRDGNPDDAKWPHDLEIAFLDALINIPPMGRRKFSYRGKPHGRNELIKEYLWIAYLDSLPPGQQPDPAMARTRKQVSSHIQVLKTFFKDHPAYDQLFPGNKGPKNGFEDSFKNDPCLRALSQGRLPAKRYDHYDEITHMMKTHYPPMRPTMFWLLITSITIETDSLGRSTGEQDLYNEGIVLHKYTGLSVEKQRSTIEAIPNWRQRFPNLAATRNLDCDIIHMDAALNLMSSYPPAGAELVSRTELTMPGCELENHIWQITTSLNMPPTLCRDPVLDPPEECSSSLNHVVSVTHDEMRIKVPFPAKAWAHALTCLTDAQLRYEEKRKSSYHSSSSDPRKSAREFVDQITMFQAIQSSPSTSHTFETRAIILWTFRKASHGELSSTEWRYLDASPPRRSVMSPSPRHSSQFSAMMNENFNAFVDTGTQPSMLDPFSAPHSAGLDSPFAANGYNFAAPVGFELPPENLSFSSTVMADSEGTLVGETTESNIDQYLANTAVGVDMDYGHDAHWHLPASESFGEDPAWANYSVPSSTPHLGWGDTNGESRLQEIHDQWNDGTDKQHEHVSWGDDPTQVQKGSWEENDPTQVQKESWEGSPQKHNEWDASPGDKHVWAPELEADHNQSPCKPHQDYGGIDQTGEQNIEHDIEHSIEHSIEQKLRPWVEHHNAVENASDGMGTDPVVSNLEHIAEMGEGDEGWIDASAHLDIGGLGTRDDGWVDVGAVAGSDEFDFARLAEQLK